jgi:hypothetical protein
MLHQGTGIFWDWALTVVPGARIVCNSHHIPFHFRMAA